MKKNTTYLGRWLSLILLTAFFPFLSIAQSASAKKTTVKEIAISLAGIEYDDPGFTALRENLKKNNKATGVKQTYNNGSAKIFLAYGGSATDLWDEIPATVKQPFKLTSIDGDAIALQLKSASKQSEANKTVSATENKSTASTAKTNEACTTCYIDLCKYDKVRTFVGVNYIGIDYDDGTHYYRCENGVLIRKLVWLNENGVTTKIETDTILKVNAPVGTYWGIRAGNDQNNSSDIRMILAKGITVEVDGKVYKDVIVVNRKKNSETNFLIKWADASSLNAYYAKGAGIVKIQQLEPNADPMQAIQQYAIQTTPVQTSTEVFQIENKTLNGKIDPTIIGIWKYTDGNGKLTFLKFNSDGTSESYTGSVAPANKNNSKGYWRVNGGVMEITWEGYAKVERYDLQKGYDAVTGKTTLAVAWTTYVSADNKTSW